MHSARHSTAHIIRQNVFRFLTINAIRYSSVVAVTQPAVTLYHITTDDLERHRLFCALKSFYHVDLAVFP